MTTGAGAARRDAFQYPICGCEAVHAQPLDASKKQQRSELKVVERRGDLLNRSGGRGFIVIERKDEEGLSRENVPPAHGERSDVVLDAEVLVGAMNARRLRVRVHRLEADAELADLREVLGLRA